MSETFTNPEVVSGKEILFAALRNERIPRPAWVPFVGVHGGKLLDIDAEQFLKSADNIVEGQKKAFELYQPDGLPVVFDLQMEAEILGCDLVWAKDAPPSVSTHPLAEKSLADLPAYSTDGGRFPLVAEAAQRLRADIGGDCALYGLITGPFTLLSHLMGSAIFMDMLMEPDKVHEAMDFCAEVGKKTSDFYVANGCEVIAVVDPMTSQISPDHFTEFVAGPLNKVFDHIRRLDAFSSLFVCGDATRNLHVMCQTSCDNVSIDENISLNLLRKLARENNKSFGGNMRLTTVLLMGTEADSMLDAIRCIDRGGTEGFVLAPGCDLPYDTPAENLQAAAKMVHDNYQRTIARTTAKSTQMETFEDITLPCYDEEEAVIVDVVTLDSSSCAPCQYMMDAASRAAQAADAKVEVREHKIKNREGVGVMCRLDVKNIPTICIDGKPRFLSEIPDGDTLVKAIETRYQEKSKA